ncbi:MAG: tRNA epoxyqueuosine(34) reductase QueG [Bacteroidota bacterium]
MQQDYAHQIKEAAYQMGFSFVGISKAARLEEEEDRLAEWLNKGYHGKMQYLENHFDKRLDPRLLVPDSKSVVTLMYNYYTEAEQADCNAPKIAKYAYGKDYHWVIKEKLRDLLDFIQEHIGEVSGRCFVDSAPVMERQWAVKSGLGWKGKNTLLIHPKAGSYFFLAELIIDLELPADGPMKDYCGTCRRCIDACPTEAISKEGYFMDSSKCISYLTIELRDALPEEFRGKTDNWMFGCDVCQMVCPWNRRSKPHQEPAFEPHPDLLSMEKSDWQELTREVFQKVFKKSAVKRTKFEGLQRNIAFLKNTHTPIPEESSTS